MGRIRVLAKQKSGRKPGFVSHFKGLTKHTSDAIKRRSEKGRQVIVEAYKNGKVSPLKKIWEENPDFLRGENNYNWKGGISKIEKSIRTMPQYYAWRSSVFERDNWTCQTCKSKGYMTAHHITSFISIVKSYNIQTREEAAKCAALWDVSNGVTLCEGCHALTDNYKHKAKSATI